MAERDDQKKPKRCAHWMLDKARCIAVCEPGEDFCPMHKLIEERKAERAKRGDGR